METRAVSVCLFLPNGKRVVKPSASILRSRRSKFPLKEGGYRAHTMGFILTGLFDRIRFALFDQISLGRGSCSK